MNPYGINCTLFDLGLSDAALFESISSSHLITDRRGREREEEDLLKLSNSILKDIERNSSPPKRRHDGTSPLPLGMDWSPPPRNWDGPNTIWPHDSHTGWSYCATVPSWSTFAESRTSEPVVFYRVQIGLQSPEGVTTTYEVLRRFSDFVKLSSDLKRSFRNKKLPPAPQKGLLRVKNRTHLEERRCSLEAWMAKVLSDIEFSRSATVACFLELEVAARASFRESSHHSPNVYLSCNSSITSDPLSSQTDISVVAGSSALASNFNNGSTYDTSQSDLCVNDRYSDFDRGNPIFDNNFVSLSEATVNEAFSENKNSATPSEISTSCEVHQDSVASKCCESIETSEALDTLSISDLQVSPDALVALPSDEQQKMNRLSGSVQQQLVTSKTDVEDLMTRLNQELAVRQYLTTKVKDLETELESIKQVGKENVEQAISVKSERYNQMQWDIEELRRKCTEMEFSLKTKQDETVRAEATKTLIIKENEALRQELDSTREQLNNLQKCHEEEDLKSKSDVKLLVREVKSLRGSQSELHQELDRVSKERMEFETILEKERTKRECVDASNRELVRECEILHGQLEECNVKFLVEHENEIKMEFPPDALDILATSQNRIGLLQAEAELLARDVATPVESENSMTMDNELKKMLTYVLIDNAKLRYHANSAIQCAFNMSNASPSSS